MGLGFHGQIDSRHVQLHAGAAKPSTTERRRPLVTHEVRQTLGGKVLSAIALERVTGRKPDPRRFNELR